jgi:hypothetical protein
MCRPDGYEDLTQKIMLFFVRFEKKSVIRYHTILVGSLDKECSDKKKNKILAWLYFREKKN